MKKVLMFCVAFAVIVFIISVNRIFFTYKVKGAQSAVITVNNLQYIVPDDLFQLLSNDLLGSSLLHDAPSCGFDRSYSIDFVNANGTIVSTLLIAQGGCGIFSLANTNLFIEGKDQARKKISDFLKTVTINN